MAKTSTAVKQRYIDKTYKQWSLKLRNEDFAVIENIREHEGLSRAEFLKMLVEKYCIDNDAKDTLSWK